MGGILPMLRTDNVTLDFTSELVTVNMQAPHEQNDREVLLRRYSKERS